MRIFFACIGHYMYIYNEPLMIVIALVLALVEKKTNNNMDLVEYVADAD